MLRPYEPHHSGAKGNPSPPFRTKTPRSEKRLEVLECIFKNGAKSTRASLLSLPELLKTLYRGIVLCLHPIFHTEAEVELA